MSPVVTLLVEIIVIIALVVLTAYLTKAERGRPDPVQVGMTKSVVLRQLGPPTKRPLTARQVIARVAAAAADDPADDAALREFWLYENTPKGSDTQIVLSRHGVVESIGVKPALRAAHAR